MRINFLPGTIFPTTQNLPPMDCWTELKQQGSPHYKTGKIEPIDLYRSAKPWIEYNAFHIKALTDVIKYAYRLLVRGYVKSDVEKIQHYVALYIADCEENSVGFDG